MLAGFSAAAVHGAKWIDASRPAEIVDHHNVRREPGVHTLRCILPDDEISTVRSMVAMNPARTALDLACRYPPATSIVAIDAVCRATDLKTAELLELVDRHTGRRGIRKARLAIGLVDPGAQSPRETWLRLLLVRAGLPRPETQLMVHDGGFVPLAYIDMGWREAMVGVEYDGDQHRTDRRQYVKDIKRNELLESLGWLIVRVVAEDHPDDILRRVHEALARRRVHTSRTLIA